MTKVLIKSIDTDETIKEFDVKSAESIGGGGKRNTAMTSSVTLINKYLRQHTSSDSRTTLESVRR